MGRVGRGRDRERGADRGRAGPAPVPRQAPLETMITEALDPAKGFPERGPGLVEAMHGGMGWSAALRISAKDHDEQDRILAILRQGQTAFVNAGGIADEFWETVTTRDVTDAIGAGSRPRPQGSGRGRDHGRGRACAHACPGKVRPERVKTTKIGTSPKVRPSSTRAMLDQAETELKGATGKRLVELRAIHALLQILSTEGGTAEDADQIASMDSISPDRQGRSGLRCSLGSIGPRTRTLY